MENCYVNDTDDFFLISHSHWFPHSPFSSLKDDDSGDHDQDQGSPKDGEKEKTEDEEKEQNVSKKKVGAYVYFEGKFFIPDFVILFDPC